MRQTKYWSINDRRLRLGSHLFVSFQRSIRLTEPSVDPPRSHGAAPLWEVNEATRREVDADVMVPIDIEEAVWIGFEPADDRVAVATRVAVDFAEGEERLDAVTGTAWSVKATASPQNYVVSPPQWSLYGISTGEGRARQFARATAAGRVDSRGVARLHLMCAPPRVMLLLRAPPVQAPVLHGEESSRGQRGNGAAMRTDAGLVPQLIHSDPYGLQHWDFETAVAVRVLFASPDEFERRSGLPRPGPLDPADTYQGKRLP